MIRALVFDFDGLILDTEMALIESYEEVHAHHGVAFDRSHVLRSVGHADYVFDPWGAFGPAADRAALDAHRRRVNIERNHQLAPLPGAAELITAAHAAGLRLGVASSTTADSTSPLSGCSSSTSSIASSSSAGVVGRVTNFSGPR